MRRDSQTVSLEIDTLINISDQLVTLSQISEPFIAKINDVEMFTATGHSDTDDRYAATVLHE